MNLHRLLGKRRNDNWSVLCVVIVLVEQRNQEKTSSFEKKDPLPSRQYTGAHLHSYDGQNNGIKISWLNSKFLPLPTLSEDH